MSFKGGTSVSNYILISVCEREIMTEQFQSLEDAQDCMHKEMIDAGDIPEDIFNHSEYDDGDFGFGKYSAYVNDGVNHSNYDWSIVEIGGCDGSS